MAAAHDSFSETSLPLANRRAVIAGGSRGIGRAIALELAAHGASVAIHGRDAAAVVSVAGEVRGLQRDADELVTDLAPPGAGERLVVEAWRQGAIDIWVHCAGADVLTGPAAELSFADKIDLLWQVDVRACLEACRVVGKRMQERGCGVILTIGWDQAQHGMAGDNGEMFAAAKGAVMAFTRSLARSLAPEVRANCLAPGWIRTAWGETASDEWQRRAKNESLGGRWGTPEDVARVAAFLASDAASFINGQIIEVNGGFAGRALNRQTRK